MFKFRYEYTDGSVKYKYFTTKQDGIMWAHYEGDRLWSYDYKELTQNKDLDSELN